MAGASGQNVSDYQISRSVRLRSSASAYFNRTPSAGNRKTWTWSAWIKRGTLSFPVNIFGTGDAATNFNASVVRFNPNNTLEVSDYTVGYTFQLVSTQVVRDPSAWGHYAVCVDTTQATASNRVKIYWNGVQVTSFSTASYPAQNLDTILNSNTPHSLGRGGSYAASYLDGYLTEVNFIDGQALPASSFGEINAITGVWSPKQYTGTYGTNGFYLNFSDNSAATAAAIGNDYSGNNNDWTPNNISLTSGATYDSMLDVPTRWEDGGNGRGNYCTLNPLAVTASTSTFADGNLKVTTANVGSNAYGTFAIPSSGKWYWEAIPATGLNPTVGVASYLVTENYAWLNSNSVFFYPSGQKYVNGTVSAYGSSFTANDVIGVAVDVDASTITFYKNNVSQGAISHTFVDMYPCLSDGASGSGDTFNINFGQRPFAYTPPSGFKALNTQNLSGNGVTTSGSFTGNASADGPFVWLNGTPTAMTINGNAVTLGTHADKTAGGFKVRSSSASYNTAGSNTYSITTNSGVFKTANAQVNP